MDKTSAIKALAGAIKSCFDRGGNTPCTAARLLVKDPNIPAYHNAANSVTTTEIVDKELARHTNCELAISCDTLRREAIRRIKTFDEVKLKKPVYEGLFQVVEKSGDQVFTAGGHPVCSVDDLTTDVLIDIVRQLPRKA